MEYELPDLRDVLPTAKPAQGHKRPRRPALLPLRAAVHPKVVSERLGQATVLTTLDTYSRAILAMEEEAAALIAGLVFAAR